MMITGTLGMPLIDFFEYLDPIPVRQFIVKQDKIGFPFGKNASGPLWRYGRW